MKKWLKNISAIIGGLIFGLALFFLFLPYGVYIEYQVKFSPKQAWAFVATKAPIEYVIKASETDQGVVGNGRTIKAFVDAIGGTRKATVKLLHTSKSTFTDYSLITGETITDNIAFDIDHGAKIDGAGTLTINGPFEAGLSQCFGSSITIDFSSGVVSEVYSKWWGTGATSINKAITASAAGGIVRLPSGNVTIDTPILIDKNLILEGSGHWTSLNVSGAIIGIRIGSRVATGNVILQNFSLIGAVANVGGIDIGTGGTYACYIALKSLHIEEFTGVDAFGIRLINAQEIDIYNCFIYGNYNGIVNTAGYLTSTHIHGFAGRIGNSTKSGIHLAAVDGVTISDQVIESNASWGIKVSAAAAGVVRIDNNYFEANATDDSTETISISGASGYPVQFTLRGNTFAPGWVNPLLKTNYVENSIVEWNSMVNLWPTAMVTSTNSDVTVIDDYQKTEILEGISGRVTKSFLKKGLADNAATTVFRIQTNNETGNTDGGAYSVVVHALVTHGVSAAGGNSAMKSLTAQFGRVMNYNGTWVNSAVTEDVEIASAAIDAGMRDIDTITVTLVETSEFLTDVQFTVDLSGAAITTANVTIAVELVYFGFLTPPRIQVP